MQKAPGGLQVICIIAILMGTCGIFAAGMGAVGPFLGQAMQGIFAQNATPNDPMAQRQEQYQKEIQAATDEWLLVNYSLLAIQFVVAGCLICGGVQALRMQPNGPKLLMIACLFAIVFELARLIPTISVQVATLPILDRVFADALQAPAGGRPLPPAARRMIEMTMTVTVYASIAISYIWLLIKIGFYSFGVRYLRRPAIRQLWEPPTDLEWSDGQPA